MSDRSRGRLRAIDLFCGAGGLSLGLQGADFDVVAALDSDNRLFERVQEFWEGTLTSQT